MKAKNLADWRELVLKRDNYACVNCNAEANLVVDHIEPRQQHPELALETDNGRVLCRNCHHRIGKRTPPNKNRMIYIDPVVKGTTLYSRLYWPKKLRPNSYSEPVDIRDGVCCIVIPKPTASSKGIAGDLTLISKYFKLKASIESREKSKTRARSLSEWRLARLEKEMSRGEIESAAQTKEEALRSE